jgi:hypothetical protein
MNFKSILTALFLFFLCITCHALSKNNHNLGIAFMHGTNDHRDDAEGGYWKSDFIQNMRAALPNPENYYVVHCDYRGYMWEEESAGCTVSQLIRFIREKKISSLIVYTHSNGANVLRWILSNPTYDRKYMLLKNKIKEVIALSPSSGGTPLADSLLDGGIFESGLSWLLGYNGDAVKQQRLGDMYIYNEELLLGSANRPSLAKPFRVVVGSNVVASPFDSSSYCNGYLLNSALKITKLYLDECADGFLNCSSQMTAGTLWFLDKDKLENNLTLSHNQSRHSCFGLEKILIQDLEKKEA